MRSESEKEKESSQIIRGIKHALNAHWGRIVAADMRVRNRIPHTSLAAAPSRHFLSKHMASHS